MATRSATLIEWVSVKERLPENADDLLAIVSGSVRHVCCWNGVFRDLRERKVSPTYWAAWPKA